MIATMKRLAAAVGVLALVAARVDAQAAAQPDARWQAWVGCWAPATTVPALGGAGGLKLCVVPTTTPSAVEMVTVVSGRITDRTRIDADGVERPVTRDGCTGTETARFSLSGTRVYVDGDVTCAGGVKRRMRNVMSFNQRYEWLDVRGVQGMGPGATTGIAVARYAASVDTARMPAELHAVMGRSAAATTAQVAASAPLTLEDIVDVSIATDSAITTAWLAERASGMVVTVTGKQLLTLAQAGVSPAVIDEVVALAHPGVFQLKANAQAAPRAGDLTTRSAVDAYQLAHPYDGYNPSCAYSFYSYNACAFGYGAYGYNAFGYYSPYGYYNPYYGYGYGYGYGGYNYYGGGAPIIVVQRGSDNPATPHGRVSRDGGYVSPGRATGGSPASGGSTSSSSAGGSSSSGSVIGTSTSGGSGGGDGGRTAVRKP